MFQFPGFAFDPYVFRIKYLYRSQNTKTAEPKARLALGFCILTSEGGFPHSEIYGSKPVSQLTVAYRSVPRPSSPLAAKASTGMPLGHLIALISNAHLRKLADARALEARARVLLLLGTVNTAYRKTSCIEINPIRSCGKRLRSKQHHAFCPACAGPSRHGACGRPGQISRVVQRLRRIPSLRCQANRRRTGGIRFLLLWTFQKI